MNKKYFFTCALSLTMVLLIFSSFSIVNCSEVPWAIGSNYNFLEQYIEKAHRINHETNTEYEIEYINNDMYLVNITDINNVTKIVSYDYFSATSSGSNSIPYDWETFISQIPTLDNLFSVSYEWDYEHNTTVLVDFECNLPLMIFLYPNWTAINNHFKTILNGSEILFTLPDPYEPITHNFTLVSILNSATSYTIMGKNTLAEAKEQFTATTSEWAFEFDFSNVIKHGEFNSTAGYNNYYSAETFKEKSELRFSDTGIIQISVYTYEFRIIVEDIVTEYFYKYLLELDGLLPTITTTTNFAYLLILPALSTLYFVPRIVKSRKN